jgi:hypothetical protein
MIFAWQHLMLFNVSEVHDLRLATPDVVNVGEAHE